MAKTFKNLTRESMAQLMVGEVIREHGIVFEKLKNGDGSFTAEFMVYGERIHRSIGRESDGTTRTHALNFVEKLRADTKGGRSDLPKGRKIALSFRDAALKYLEHLPAIGGKDMKMKQSRLELHLIPFFGKMQLSKISSVDVDTYKHARLNEFSQRGGDRVSKKARVENTNLVKSSEGTVNRELAVLSHLFSMAIEWKWITHRPAKISRLKEGDGRIMYLTVEQTQSLIAHAKESDNCYLHPFILIGLGTSMRTSEILSIQIKDIDTSKLVIYIPKAKGGQREQPMTAHLAAFLQSYIEMSVSPSVPWLFPSPTSKSGHMIDIRKPFIKAVKAAGLNPSLIVRHTLRHTAITHLVQARVDLPTVKRISGHKTLAMVEKYAHQNGEHIADAMNVFEKRMGLT